MKGEDGFKVGEKYPRLEVGVGKGPQPRWMSQSSLFWEKSSLRLPRLVTFCSPVQLYLLCDTPASASLVAGLYRLAPGLVLYTFV